MHAAYTHSAGARAKARVTTTKPAFSLSLCAISLSVLSAQAIATIYPSLYRPSLKLYSTHKQNGFRNQRRAADLNATRDAATRARLVAL